MFEDLVKWHQKEMCTFTFSCSLCTQREIMQTNSESVSSTSTSSQVLASKIKTSTPKVGSQLFSSNLHYQELVVRHQTIYIYYFHQSHDIAHC